MTYKGYTLETYEDVEENENIKILHFAISASGREVNIDWSPYHKMTEEQFKQYIDAGLPTRFDLRQGGGPLDQKDLDQLSRRVNPW